MADSAILQPPRGIRLPLAAGTPGAPTGAIVLVNRPRMRNRLDRPTREIPPEDTSRQGTNQMIVRPASDCGRPLPGGGRSSRPRHPNPATIRTGARRETRRFSPGTDPFVTPSARDRPTAHYPFRGDAGPPLSSSSRRQKTGRPPEAARAAVSVHRDVGPC
jgi:hypothetical protein